ncbi:MAG: 4-vinyl reductase [Chloroflexi bacterium]|nr:4-vinyl reductase [Chloroflexota bacterium]MBI1854265.1 4-vinyl reductase [Chloroflexota bacterium]MBI2759005.1 4-vinyl reductase [Chloroflexota bacterium]MBI3339562.1 4-vinyl reductase [Chloroflexota bacterium]
MSPIQKAGLYYPNKFGLITIKSLEEVMGKNGLNAILNLAGLNHYVENYPPDNLEKGFDFSELSAIGTGLEEMYGPRGGRGLALRAGRATFADALKNFGALAGVADLAFVVLPLHAKLRIGLPSMAKIFSQLSDQHSTVEEKDNEFIYTIHKCPCCWGRHDADKPVCFIATGLLQEGLKWISGGNEFRVNESKCVAVGDDVCEFVIQKEPIS